MAVQSQTRVETLANYVGGQWMPSSATDFVHVHNPARGDVIARTPLSTRSDVDAAVRAAAKAFPGWSETPPVTRARAMFRFKQLLEEHFEEIARIVTTEHGKTLDESRGSVRRGIECVEVACGAPSMLMGYGLENVAHGIDCTVMRQPIGVCAAIAPFNFP
ncbi:MAG TPA: aldehyde dehydrogenase family protein, partial [Vicinamibacterales bacterium]|nr:aldehyde dehydrogenase family protein [Vicinamibacterales bacterium]